MWSHLREFARGRIPRKLAQKISPSDLVQDTFLIAQRQIARFRGNSEDDLHAWLRGILANRLLFWDRKFLRTKKREVRRERSLNRDVDSGDPTLQLNTAALLPSDELLHKERLETLAAAFAALAESDRRVIWLRRVEERTFSEIAADLQIAEEAARQRWLRAIERFRAAYRRAGGADSNERPPLST
jgi:RNA polymerase sigma-70 factor (ECF subfamily)